MLRNTLVLLAMSLSLMACGMSQEELETPAAAEAPAANVETREQNLCEPGPSSNWCENVAGKACSTTVSRRCYLPNYCEWLYCRCIGGTWQCE
ncbi:hypothetical protein D187_003949 [Cystobacter fuscus DSM 2262]|uniref:Lipoprotein n=1 Tax=Cystobacter fuscus (strain ATCC 25194 / DSM 2262 / NBRC 100088 / M29) TaxID=1242864 RepID=S9P8A9_CYSF2|nr:hypothetical protein [Cystobacter fuscus]EPX58477.1 hypothetical protein D187_003949 [Cystobacter fuscus DSM 2262]